MPLVNFKVLREFYVGLCLNKVDVRYKSLYRKTPEAVKEFVLLIKVG